MSDWHDRLIDASLHELHGRRPPDLSSRVVSALERAPIDPSPVVVQRPAAARTPPFVWWCVAGAAAMVAVALCAAAWCARDQGAPDQVVAALEIAVLGGEIECVEFESGRASDSRHAAPLTVSFAARPGNRLRCAAPCRARVGPFGIVECDPIMELEVKSMEFSWKSGVVAASSLTVAVVAGVVTWHSLTRTETATAGETLRLQAVDNGGGELAAENARLLRRIERLEQENAALRIVPTREAEPVPVAVAPEPPPAEPPPDSMVFKDEAYAKALEGIDWKTMGEVTKEMGPLLAKLIESMKNGEELPQELAVQIQELNMKLVAQVPALMKSGLPGFGPNGAYTHPLVVANVLANTLAAAGQPLDDAQRAKIDGLVRAFSAESQSIAGASRDFDVEQLALETEMKDRFYRELSSHLLPGQSETMYPPGSTGYDGASLFNTGLMTRPFTEAIPAKNAADFARIASNRLGEDLGLDEASAAQVRAIVERVAGASPELWRDPSDATERNLRMLKTGRASTALRRQIELMREIQRTVPMSPEQLKKFKGLKGVLVPLPK